MPAIALFTIVTLLPVPLLVMGALSGGYWVLGGLLFMTALAAGLDELIARITPASDDSEFPAANALSITLALAHFGLLFLTIRAFANPDISTLAKVGLVAAVGLFFGQVSNSNAHELIHRSTRTLHRLGMWVYISMMFGHHTSAHVLVHHRHVATRTDPSTSRLGESYYRFVWRSWRGAFRAGFAAEQARLARVGRGTLHNPYVIYISGAALMLAAAAVIGGVSGLIGYVAVCVHAQSQLLLSDYVQHYGLARRTDADGRTEPVGDQHSWNTPHWFSSALMLNAPRHSAHHAHPGRHYPALDLPPAGPMLPRSLPVMATVALIPPLWRRVMDPRVREVQA